MAQDSIYYYKPGEFKQFILRIDDKTLTVLEALSTFRETKSLANGFRTLTIQRLVDKPSLIPELRLALRNVMDQNPDSSYYTKKSNENQN
jgi:hypothetical protein